MDTAIVQPLAIRPVKLFDVLKVQGAEAGNQRDASGFFSTSGAINGLAYLHQKALMRGAMRGQTGKALLLQEALLALEVLAREVNQLLQPGAGLCVSAAVHERQAQFVHRIHQDAMLIVHGFYADGAGVRPR